MALTLAEAQAQLITVNAAIEQLVQNKRVNRLEVGSGSFKRVFVNQECSLDALTAYRDYLLGIINALDTTSTPTFLRHTHIPLQVKKDRF